MSSCATTVVMELSIHFSASTHFGTTIFIIYPVFLSAVVRVACFHLARLALTEALPTLTLTLED